MSGAHRSARISISSAAGPGYSRRFGRASGSSGLPLLADLCAIGRFRREGPRGDMDQRFHGRRELPRAPRTDPHVRLSRMRLPPRVDDGGCCRMRANTCSRLSGSEPGTCLIGPRSPRSLPFAPPTPPQIRFVRWLRSYYDRVRLLGSVHHRLRLLTFPMRAGKGNTVPVRPEISQLPMRSFYT